MEPNLNVCVRIRSEVEVEPGTDEVALSFLSSSFLLFFCPDRQTAFHPLLCKKKEKEKKERTGGHMDNAKVPCVCVCVCVCV